METIIKGRVGQSSAPVMVQKNHLIMSFAMSWWGDTITAPVLGWLLALLVQFFPLFIEHLKFCSSQWFFIWLYCSFKMVRRGGRRGKDDSAAKSTRYFYGGSRINSQHHMVAPDLRCTQFWITLFWPLPLLDRHNYCLYIHIDKAPTHIK